MGILKAQLAQDMHYADFAEDEVRHSGSLPTGLFTYPSTECRFASGYQRIRSQQMEGYWRKSWEACQGQHFPPSNLRWSRLIHDRRVNNMRRNTLAAEFDATIHSAID